MISIDECYEYARQCDELAAGEPDDRSIAELRRLATLWRALAATSADTIPRSSLN